MEIKICGLTKPEEAKYLEDNHVDYAGMVLFYPKSKRNIDINKAREIMAALNPDIKKVAVVVSPDPTQIMSLCLAGFDLIQVHDQLSDLAYELCSLPIWKAFNVKDLDSLESYRAKDKITGFVFDSATPGSGQAYDLSLLKDIDIEEDKLFILAGGLNSDNVGQAIRDVLPDIVDVSSGVEYSDRLGKNPEKISAFVNAVRSAT